MEADGCCKGSKGRSVNAQPSSEGLGSSSEQSPSDREPEGGSKTPSPCVKTPEPCSEATDKSSDSFFRPPCPGSFYTDRGQFGFKPLYISYTSRGPDTESSTAVPPSSSEPCHSNVPSSYPIPSSVASHPGHSSYPTSLHGPTSATSAPDSSTSPLLSSSTPETVRDLQPDQPPTYHHWDRPLKLEPQKQLWQSLRIPEPGVRGQWTPSDFQKKPVREPLPRGHTLLNNWEEERATNHLDQVPRSHDGSESFFFRYGHQGLLTIQPQLPMSSITSHKDSYPIPRNVCQPLRGKREAMMEILLHQRICKEVQAEQEPEKKLFEAKSVTHHDYQVELVQAGPPAPTKPHDYRYEQPETFWKQRAPQLPGVSCIRTLDTPFRKNSSFSTPVPLSLGRPLPYEHGNFSHQTEVTSSLACQGGGQGCPEEEPLQPKA